MPTPSPDVETVLAGHETREPTWCWRPHGTATPLLIHTRAGAGRVRGRSGGEHLLSPGDTVVWLPGAPHDFGCLAEDRTWEILWVHARPREHWPRLTSWLALAPGVRWVPSPDPQLRVRIAEALVDTVASAHAPTTHAVPLAMNALERALLWLDAASPGVDQLDGRVHDALDFVARHMHQPLDVATIAAAVHLSPSRLGHLFAEQVGVPPARYVERRRLERAQHLLASTSMTVGAIARASGFSSQFYFATRFKQHTGVDPSTWRVKTTLDQH